MVQLALGQRPDFPHREGPFPFFSKFYLRSFVPDATVHGVPSEGEIKAVQERFSEAIVEIRPEKGERLSEMREQEPHSYILAEIYLGGETRDQLQEKFNYIRDLLTFDLQEHRASS